MKRSLIIITILSIIAGACSKNNDTPAAPLSHADSVRIADSVRVTDSVHIQDSLAHVVYNLDFIGTLHDKTYSDYSPIYELDTTIATGMRVTIVGNSVTFSLQYFKYDFASGQMVLTTTGPLEAALTKSDAFNVKYGHKGGALLNNRHGLRAYYSTNIGGNASGVDAEFVGTR